MPETPLAPVLYAGPTSHGLDSDWLVTANVQLRPPARRGDIQRLVDSGDAPGVLIVCDGVFQVAPAISHAELCAALDVGWQVWGVSSLGAIRAHELRGEGMQGFGEVFAMFTRFDDFTDDELCLLHFPEPPWFPVSEPLVNLRHALATQGHAFGINETSARAVLAALSQLWFGDRTIARMHHLLCSMAGCSDRQAGQLLSWQATHRVKTTDLQALLQQRPWAVQHEKKP